MLCIIYKGQNLNDWSLIQHHFSVPASPRKMKFDKQEKIGLNYRRLEMILDIQLEMILTSSYRRAKFAL